MTPGRARVSAGRRLPASTAGARLAMLSAALTVLCGCAAPPPDETPEVAAPPVAVRVAAVARGSITEEVQATGETAALTAVRLASPVSGRVTAVAVQAGDRVAANAVVARVRPQENEAALHGLGVLNDAGALRSDERPAAERLARDLAGRDIGLRAPFAGVVAERLHNPGEQVAPNDVLLEVFDPRSLVVLAQVPLAHAATVQAGQPAVVRFGAAAVPGRVAAVLGAITPQSLTVPVRIQLDGAPPVPLLHAAADTRITVAAHHDVLLVPTVALLTNDHREHGSAMVVTDGVAHVRAIRMGLQNPDAVEVLAGVTAGDLVVVAGQYGLPDGAAVTTLPATPD